MSVYITDKDGKLVKVSGNILPLSAQSVALNTTRTGQNDTVIDYYMSSDGKTWYRKWASGWKECGGIISNQGFITTTMPVTFSNTNYTLLSGTTTSVEESREMIVVKFKNKTTSTFRSALSYLYNDGGYGYSSSAYSWYACGF